MLRRLATLAIILVVIAVAAAAYRYSQQTPSTLTLTGVVTTDELVASSQIAGRISEFLNRRIEFGNIRKPQ